MLCPRCRHDNRPGAKFCEECAAPLARRCANCGAELSATAKFCPDCAHPAAAGAASASAAPPTDYTPAHLAERILTSKSALEGERKQVTVLFADLKGSMELLADRDPEDARKLLDPVVQRMMEAVHRYEGTVNQVMGDGIMALFGAPLALEDHAVRACYAALRMQEAVGAYGAELLRAEGLSVQIRVGVHSGEVVVRSIGSDLRMDYSAIGQTTHLAARMEQTARPGTTLVTAGTLALAEGYVQVRPLGPVPVKGLDAPVEVYELTGAENVRSRLRAAAARGLSRFVGRDTELELIRRALEQARHGRGQVVAVVGEAGVGVYSEPGLEPVVEVAVNAALALAPEPLLSFFDPDPTQDLRPLLPRIAVPTLVTRGTADRVSGAADAEELAAGIRGARLHPFPGRCHVPIFTATTEFCEVLRRFARPTEGETSP